MAEDDFEFSDNKKLCDIILVRESSALFPDRGTNYQ